MPFYKDAMGHGNLYIKFLVQFPKKGELKDPQIKELQKVNFKNIYINLSFDLDSARTQSKPSLKERSS